MSERNAGDDEAWREWLTDRAGGDHGITGFDAVGWEDETWVLHALYERPGIGQQRSYDELHREALALGLVEPLVVGELDLDALGVVQGGALGMSAVGPGWARLRWRDLAVRLSITPAIFLPPDEGSLDRMSLYALLSELSASSPQGATTPCLAYYCPLATGANFDEFFIRHVVLGELASVIDPGEGRIGSPSNWWPADRRWMVHTDWDLWATKVSGPRSLVDRIRAAAVLECIGWPRGA